jgi:ABC-2 type transport system ATP-binding protein
MIELRNIEKKYGGATVLSDVSLTVAEGDFFALLGPNGAGKTTIIRILLDFTRASSGSAWIGGRSTTEVGVRSQIGYLPENMQIPSYVSGASFIKRQAALGGLSGKACDREVDRLVELVGMSQKARQTSGTYSKGMLQRIGLAAALIGSPKLLILDEPTNGLDPIGIREFRGILERIRHDRVTLLLNSHILSEVEKLCGTAAILDKGRVVVKGPIAGLVREGETLEDVFVRNVRAGG